METKLLEILSCAPGENLLDGFTKLVARRVSLNFSDKDCLMDGNINFADRCSFLKRRDIIRYLKINSIFKK